MTVSSKITPAFSTHASNHWLSLIPSPFSSIRHVFLRAIVPHREAHPVCPSVARRPMKREEKRESKKKFSTLKPYFYRACVSEPFSKKRLLSLERGICRASSDERRIRPNQCPILDKTNNARSTHSKWMNWCTDGHDCSHDDESQSQPIRKS